MRFVRMLDLLLLAGMLCAASQAVAATSDINVQCFADVASPPSGFAVAALPNETGGSPAYRDAGIDFDHSSDKEAWCQFIVPANYDSTSGTHPSVLVFGFSKDCVLCIPNLTCGATDHVKFSVSSRPEVSGSSIYQGWSTDATTTLNYTSQACGSPCSTNCYIDDVMKSFTSDATSSAANWNVGDLVLIRLRRDTSVSNNLPSVFHTCGTIRVTYPIP